MKIEYGADLYKLTGFESGIIIYPDSRALLTNWFALHTGGIPRLLGQTVIGLGGELTVLEKKDLSKKEIQDIIVNIQNNIIIISDTDDKITPDDVTSGGKMYKIESNGEIFTVITVDDWH